MKKNASLHILNNLNDGIPQIIQITVTLISLIIISPLLLITALAIKIESKGPIIFKQVRVGKNGRRFTMYKFRSMYLPSDKRFKEPNINDSSRDGVCLKFENDPRVTKIGSIIRKYSIDEIPQLFNVVKGDMLLIGPRPALQSESDQYEWYMLERFDKKGGLTGLWQVSGRADTTFDEQIDLDIFYVRNKSFMMDIKIILSTIPVVIFGKGAY